MKLPPAKSSKKMLIPLCVTLNLLSSMRKFPVLLFLLAACSDSNGLPDAALPNVERSETLYALVGTPITSPSAYAIEGNRRIRTDVTVDFDFAYNVEADGRRVFIPRAVLGIDPNASVRPGFQLRTESFEAITEARSNGYITDRVVPIAEGERYVVRSRITCLTIGVPKYAKLEVLSFNDTTRTVTFRVLTDDNCGFKGLEPGLPDR
jgi:hypothetical protein